MTDQPVAALALTAPDERAHAPGEERLWGESWYFDFTNREGTLGGYVRLGLYPNLDVAFFTDAAVLTKPLTVGVTLRLAY